MSPRSWTIDWDRPAADRRLLAGAVVERLLEHPNVVAATPFGSLASPEPDGYPADALSDIDIRVTVDGCSDRALHDQLEHLLSGVGPVLRYSLFTSSRSCTGSFLFDTYSPFWHVDVVCYADEHEDAADLLEALRLERAFGAWLSTVKRFARAGAFLETFHQLVPSAGAGGHRPATLFGALLDDWRAAGGDPVRHEIGREVLRHLWG